MYKYKNFTLIIFLILVAGWSFFFWAFKYYFWSSLQWSINPSLELIAGYLSLGTGLAYLFGWVLSFVFQERYIILGAGLTIAALSSIFAVLGLDSLAMFSILVVLVGVFYGLWSTVKNVLISTEIQKTWYSDTAVNSFVTISFLISLILWSIIGGYLYQRFSVYWVWFIVGVIVAMWLLALTLKYNNWTSYDNQFPLKQALGKYLPSMKFILGKYWKVMVYGWAVLGIGTILSQKAIEMWVLHFHQTPAKAALLLGYTWIGTIIWSLLSVKMNTKRLLYFRVSCVLFALLIIAFPLLVTTFESEIYFLFIAWILFWIALNLIDGFIFLQFGVDNVKEFGSWAYWLIISITIALLMLLSNISTTFLWFNTWFYFLGFLILVIGLTVEFKG